MLIVGNREFMVPADAKVKMVNPKGRHPTAHVLADGKVSVLSVHGQLEEAERDAISRAGAEAWRAVGGDVI